jgi:glutamate racemase
MSSSKPIGIFDSGIGGLTVMAELIKTLPKEDLIYFGDTARVPYGSKSKEVVTAFSQEIVAFLLRFDVKMIVVACNTASAYAIASLREKVRVPILGVIEPGSLAAATASSSRRMGVIGTEGTIKSKSYEKAIRFYGPDIKIFTKACPLFVPLVEEGWTDHPVTYSVAREYLKGLVKKNIDTLLLGCTHYPLLRPVIRKTVGKRIGIIDSAVATALEVKNILDSKGIENEKKKKGSYKFFVSDSPEKFRLIGRRFLKEHIKSVNKVSF